MTNQTLYNVNISWELPRTKWGGSWLQNLLCMEHSYDSCSIEHSVIKPESWTKKLSTKNWCFWTVVLQKTLESPLDCKEIQPVHSEGDQSQVFIGKNDAEAETPTFWPPDGKNWLFGKDPDAGKDWGQEKETTDDEMVGWDHWHNGHEFEWAPRVGDGQGSLACCSPWGCRVRHD